jgi:hypothetical protein
MARDHESTHDSWIWRVASAKSVEDVDVEWQDYDYDEQGSSTPAPSHQPVTNDAPPPRPAPTTHPHRSTTNKDVMDEMTRRIDRLEILHIEKARVMEGKIDGLEAVIDGLEGKIDEILHILKADLKDVDQDVDSGSAAVSAAS